MSDGSIPDMTTLDMATIDELVDELSRRSDLLFLYHEFEGSDGPKYHIRQTGDKLRLLGVLQARILPDLIRMIRHHDASQMEADGGADPET